MRLEPVGEMTDAEVKDATSTVIMPIIAYHHKTRKARTTDIEFRLHPPLGIDLEVIRAQEREVVEGMVTSKVPAEKVLEYIERSLTEKGRVTWEGMLADDDYIITGGTLGKVYRALVGAHAGNVPTKRRAGSPRTSSSTKPTSGVASKRTGTRRVALGNS